MDDLERIRNGVRCGRTKSGWWAEKARPTLTGHKGAAMSGGTFWGVVKFFVVPNRYYVWRYKRKYSTV